MNGDIWHSAGVDIDYYLTSLHLGLVCLLYFNIIRTFKPKLLRLLIQIDLKEFPYLGLFKG